MYGLKCLLFFLRRTVWSPVTLVIPSRSCSGKKAQCLSGLASLLGPPIHRKPLKVCHLLSLLFVLTFCCVLRPWKLPTHGNPPASVSQVLELQVYLIPPDLTLYFSGHHYGEKISWKDRPELPAGD